MKAKTFPFFIGMVVVISLLWFFVAPVAEQKQPGNKNSQQTNSQIKIAVASNFRETSLELIEKFEAESGINVIPIFGSTGKHYAQIENGAPFDVFLAADQDRPLRLEQEGVAVKGTRFTYAVGQLVLWARDTGSYTSLRERLENGEFRHLAIANPVHAPYGLAAKDLLQSLHLWDSYQSRLVRAENINQAFQLVQSGNAEMGLISVAQLYSLEKTDRDRAWHVEEKIHDPILQDAVLLTEAEGARAFMNFLQSDKAKLVIENYGYNTAVPVDD